MGTFGNLSPRTKTLINGIYMITQSSPLGSHLESACANVQLTCEYLPTNFFSYYMQDWLQCLIFYSTV